MDLLDNLNKNQKDAVTTTEGIVRVIAGAGSGKTKALTTRYSYLVEKVGISPSNILCVTFTNKASMEMKKRVRSMIGDRDMAFICTFHSFCVQVLKEEIHRLNYPKTFMILDNLDSNSMLAEIYAEKGITLKEKRYSDALGMIAERKNVLSYVEQTTQMEVSKLRDKYLKAQTIEDQIYWGYLYKQRRCFALDFNDLIRYVVYILIKHSDLLDKWSKKLEYIMVDEFQDVNYFQYILGKLLSSYHKNLFVVGDPDQTIYSFRGANIEFFTTKFESDYKDIKTICLNTNYRSSPNILKVSNELIVHNSNRIENALVSNKKEAQKVIYHHAQTEFHESEWIVEQIKELQGKGVKLKDITILYRSNFLTRQLEQSLMKGKVNYKIFGALGFFERKEIKDVLSYLRLVICGDDLSFKRIINEPKRTFGEKRMALVEKHSEDTGLSLYESLKELLWEPLIQSTGASQFVKLIEKCRVEAESLTPSEILEKVLEDSGYEQMLRKQGEQERLDNLAELKQSVLEYEQSVGEEVSIQDYLEKITLFTQLDKEDTSDSVKLMSIHMSKGLEFKNVFVCGLNEGVFPSRRTKTIQDMEEERRIAYVAYTRAEDRLFISDAHGYTFDGTEKLPSRFITEVKFESFEHTNEEAHKQYWDILSKNKLTENKGDNVKFSIGEEVKHSLFGVGKVLESSDAGIKIKFNNNDTVRTISREIAKKALVKL